MVESENVLRLLKLQRMAAGMTFLWPRQRIIIRTKRLSCEMVQLPFCSSRRDSLATEHVWYTCWMELLWMEQHTVLTSLSHELGTGANYGWVALHFQLFFGTESGAYISGMALLQI